MKMNTFVFLIAACLCQTDPPSQAPTPIPSSSPSIPATSPTNVTGPGPDDVTFEEEHDHPAADTGKDDHTIMIVVISVIGAVLVCICLCCICVAGYFYRTNFHLSPEDDRIDAYDQVDVDGLDEEDDRHHHHHHHRRHHRRHTDVEDVDMEDYEEKAANVNIK